MICTKHCGGHGIPGPWPLPDAAERAGAPRVRWEPGCSCPNDGARDGLLHRVDTCAVHAVAPRTSTRDESVPPCIFCGAREYDRRSDLPDRVNCHGCGLVYQCTWVQQRVAPCEHAAAPRVEPADSVENLRAFYGGVIADRDRALATAEADRNDWRDKAVRAAVAGEELEERLATAEARVRDLRAALAEIKRAAVTVPADVSLRAIATRALAADGEGR